MNTSFISSTEDIPQIITEHLETSGHHNSTERRRGSNLGKRRQNSQLRWSDLTYEYEKKKKWTWTGRRVCETTSILKQQSGYIKCGSMTAILGPSGSGKTT